MPKNAFDQILSAFRTGASDFNARSGDTISQIADSVSRVLDEAGSEGAKIKKVLVRNWSSLERPRPRRAVPMILGIVALGAATAYFLGRSLPAESRG